ncbi:MAG: tetratricopeptide repeat protein [Pseudomonadota bacterium]
MSTLPALANDGAATPRTPNAAPPQSTRPSTRPTPPLQAQATGDEEAEASNADLAASSAEERDRILDDLYARLGKSESADFAKVVQIAIERMWGFSGSDTVDLLMRRAQAAIAKKNETVATNLLDAVVGLRPEYAEGWNRRAFVHFSNKDYERAFADLRRVVIIDPKHFKAIGGLAVILREWGRDKAALAAFRKALEVNPFDEDVRKAIRELEIEVEGQKI